MATQMITGWVMAAPGVRLSVVELVFDIRSIAKLADEFLELLVALALADRAARFLPAALLRHVLLAPLEHLDEMPAERRADRLRDFVHRQLVHSVLEIRHGVAGGKPSEVTAFRARRILRVRARELLEARAGDEALAQAVDSRLRIGLGRLLVDFDED